MATTSIWSIKNNLKQSINYIINPEKTINKDYDKNSFNYLEISTIKYNFKNEKVCYVSYLNCSEDDPYEDMKFTKERLELIKNNLNNFDKDIQKEKENSINNTR